MGIKYATASVWTYSSAVQIITGSLFSHTGRLYDAHPCSKGFRGVSKKKHDPAEVSQIGWFCESRVHFRMELTASVVRRWLQEVLTDVRLLNNSVVALLDIHYHACRVGPRLVETRSTKARAHCALKFAILSCKKWGGGRQKQSIACNSLRWK